MPGCVGSSIPIALLGFAGWPCVRGRSAVGCAAAVQPGTVRCRRAGRPRSRPLPGDGGRRARRAGANTTRALPAHAGAADLTGAIGTSATSTDDVWIRASGSSWRLVSRKRCIWRIVRCGGRAVRVGPRRSPRHSAPGARTRARLVGHRDGSSGAAPSDIRPQRSLRTLTTRMAEEIARDLDRRRPATGWRRRPAAPAIPSAHCMKPPPPGCARRSRAMAASPFAPISIGWSCKAILPDRASRLTSAIAAGTRRHGRRMGSV